MSFAARQHTLIGQVVSPIDITIYDHMPPPAPSAVGSVTFSSDGTLSVGGNGSATTPAWRDPTGPGVGSDYWIRFTLLAGDVWDSTGGISSGTIYSLAPGRILTWSVTGAGKLATVGFEIFSDAGGAGLDYSGSFNVFVNNTEL